MLIDYDMSIGDAFHTPRIDLSNLDKVVVDDKLPTKVASLLSKEFSVVSAPRTFYPYNFACPAAVSRVGDVNYGVTEIMSAWSDSIASL